MSRRSDHTAVSHPGLPYFAPPLSHGARRQLRRARHASVRSGADPDILRGKPTRGRPDDRLLLPRSGERGPAALRCYLPFRTRAHRATTAVLAFAYPFLAEAGLDAAGVLIGRDTYSGGSFVYDPWMLYRAGTLINPNVLLAGVIGTGKSSLAKSLVTRSISFGKRVYVPGDSKGSGAPYGATD
jgi:hypothetical protein